MSTLYLGSDLPALAGRLADVLTAERGDFFVPVRVVVPNRYLRKWLRLWLARRFDVAVNFRFHFLEDALWLLLREADPRRHAVAPEPLDENSYRLLVLAVLLEERDPGLAPLQRYAQLLQPPLSRLSCRRAWHLAERLASLLQEYEYHRQDTLIQRWLRGELGLGQASDFHQMMERAQQALFAHITREPDGRRALLNRLAGPQFKTFPQYAMELLTQAEAAPVGREVVHVFGLTQVSELHTRTLAWLGRHFDLRVYHVNALASRVRGTLTARNLQNIVQGLREAGPEEEGGDRGRALLRLWGRAGTEALGLMAHLLTQRSFAAEVLPATSAAPPLAEPKANRKAAVKKPAPTVLTRLQDHLLGRTRAGPVRLAQDASLQIVGCPGSVREVETVYNSILYNLQRYPQLRQTDIAVLVSDMPRYRPLLQAVFERPPQRLQYNLVDFSAAGLSPLGQGLLDMLDLAMESFTRSRVFQVLLNPCFLARLRVDRAQALTWLGWAETLGIYRGWDADERHEQGYPRSPFYAWRLGLQRLRLGRFMEMDGDDGVGPAPRFGHVIPFADLASTDREHLDAFCRAVEGLLPFLARLRSLHADGRRWSGHLQRLLREFLDVPADRPEEVQVRDELFAACERLIHWDYLREAGSAAPGLPLPLVREYVHGQLEKLEGSKGEYLVGGVTLAALQPMRPVPFSIVYVVGLSEDLFPGSNALSTFDLRGAGRLPGDIRPAEQHLYEFLEATLAAQQKLYLLYNNHELQRDQPLQPSVPLQQMKDFLSEHVLKESFEIVTMPLEGNDDAFFCAEKQPEYQDVLVQYRDVDRLLAFMSAERAQRWAPDLNQQAELAEQRAKLQVRFEITAEPGQAESGPLTIALTELKRFLQLPAQESLRRHLRVGEDEAPELDDDEPLVTPPEPGNFMIRQTLQALVLRACQGDVEEAIKGWDAHFRQLYADARLRCRVPADAFGEIDQDALRRDLDERINGAGGVGDFLRRHAGQTVCGPLLIGESAIPIGARYRFPALVLPASRPLRIVGSTPFAWCGERRFELLVVTSAKGQKPADLTAYLFEPVLLYLTLLANREPGPKGISPQSWIAPRDFQVHVAFREGIQTWHYPVGAIRPEEALEYLISLTRDLLDPNDFDLLPFDVLGKVIELRRAYAEEGTALPAEQYRQLFEENVAEARDNPFRFNRIPLLVDMIGARVPADALAKVRRRFRLLDRGPARFRTM
jgi:exodeoxyribonuclease V gamma subunit